jgi:hypothetical protein
MEENEMGRVCSTHDSDEKPYKPVVGKPQRRDHLGDLSVDRIILKRILKKQGARV